MWNSNITLERFRNRCVAALCMEEYQRPDGSSFLLSERNFLSESCCNPCQSVSGRNVSQSDAHPIPSSRGCLVVFRKGACASTTNAGRGCDQLIYPDSTHGARRTPPGEEAGETSGGRHWQELYLPIGLRCTRTKWNPPALKGLVGAVLVGTHSVWRCMKMPLRSQLLVELV